MSIESKTRRRACTSPAYRQRSPLYFAWRRFLANKAAVVGGVVLAILILAAIFAPLFTKTDPTAQAFLTQALAFPSAEFWFGVDDLGRDFFTRIVYGARVSLTIGFAAAAFSVVIGIPLGALAGYFGGKTDWVIMRIIELFSVVPSLLAALLLGALTRGGFFTIILIAALFGWVQVCLLVRAQVKAFKEKEFVRAAQALGAIALVHHPPPPHPQLDLPDHRRLRARHPARDDARSEPQLPRHRRAAADPELGPDDQHRHRISCSSTGTWRCSRPPRSPSPCSRRRCSATACAMHSIPP